MSTTTLRVQDSVLFLSDTPIRIVASQWSKLLAMVGSNGLTLASFWGRLLYLVLGFNYRLPVYLFSYQSNETEQDWLSDAMFDGG